MLERSTIRQQSSRQFRDHERALRRAVHGLRGGRGECHDSKHSGGELRLTLSSTRRQGKSCDILARSVTDTPDDRLRTSVYTEQTSLPTENIEPTVHGHTYADDVTEDPIATSNLRAVKRNILASIAAGNDGHVLGSIQNSTPCLEDQDKILPVVIRANFVDA
ncbi:hypothetical protein Tco_0949078 [Tanacetum coccineum]